MPRHHRPRPLLGRRRSVPTAAVCALALLSGACSGDDAPRSSPASQTSSIPAASTDDTGDTDDTDDTGDFTAATTPSELTVEGTSPAPEFPAGLEWFNTDDKALTFADDLQGKIVLLDFWTSGCINCIHIIPDLERLEAEHPTQLVVIGVHSAKFANEATSSSIRDSILRYGLEHPVVNDDGMGIWNLYGARAWPTLVLVDPNGMVVGGHEGEGVYDAVSPLVATMAEEFGAAGLIDDRPFELVLEAASAAPTVLSFPGDVLADPDGGRLFVSDSGHDRVLVASSDGTLELQIGAGVPGLVDGDVATAQFSNPQGLALSADGDTLYVADTDNHALRAVDLTAGTVETIAGTGSQARSYPDGSPGRDTPLSSPWDVLRFGDTLFLAMAGLHQIWGYDLAADAVGVFVGSGREGIDDGPPQDATLAQPSGLATDGTNLYFTDPETSAVRSVALDGTGEVRTLIGTGLFDFGDVDGTQPDARLQHAIGIAVTGPGRLVIADTYNDKLKTIDVRARTSTTLAGRGTPGIADGVGTSAALAEPTGLSFDGETLYVADTNNHLVRTVEVATGTVSTLVLSNLAVASRAGADVIVPVETVEALTVASGTATFEITFDPPDGYKINDLGPFSVTVSVDDRDVVAYAGSGEPTVQVAGPSFPVTLPVRTAAGSTTVHAVGTVFYCREGNEGLCLIRDYALDIPVTVTPSSSSTRITVAYSLPAV